MGTLWYGVLNISLLFKSSKRRLRSELKPLFMATAKKIFVFGKNLGS